MKRLSFLFCAILFCIGASAQDTVRTYWKNNKLMSIGVEKAGMEEGHWVFYHINGAKWTEGDYVDGRKVGVWRTWYEDGTLNQDGTITVSSTWGHNAPYIDMDGKGVGAISILVKYSGLDITQIYNTDGDSIGVAFASILDSDTNVVGSCVQKVGGVADNTVRAYYCGAGNSQVTPRPIGSMTAVEGSGYLLFSYKDTEGSRTYMGTSIANLTGGEDTAGHWSGRALKKIVLGGDESGKAYNGAGFKIEEVALFVDEFYTAEDVADYEFPPDLSMFRSDLTVTEVNAIFGTEPEITLRLADGVTVTGDTNFNASIVHFVCDGSFNLKPPANNEATFDFYEVTGRPVLIYDALPAVSGTKFTSTVIPSFVTDPTQWTGTIYISSATVTDFTSNPYGNESSVVRLGNVSGWLRAPGNYAFTNTVPVEIAGVLTINNGNSANDSNPNKCAVFKKLSGSGWISTDSGAAGVVIVIQDASEFTGSLGLSSGKYIVFGETMPDYATLTNTTVGTIFVMPGVKVTNRGFWWATGGIKVDGELSAPNRADYFGGGTTITTSDTGVLEITRSDSPSADDGGTDYSRVTGTGTIRFAGEGFTVISQSIPTSLTFAAEKANGSVVPVAGATIGSLTGSKGFRSDWGTTGAGGRYLTIKQSKDTIWDGSICVGGAHRLTGVIVDPGANSTGTLTMTAIQTTSSPLTVNGSVNLTGTWVGPTTVNGTLSGTGTVNGELTLADGSTLVADTADPLTVSSLSLPSTGTVTISLADSDIGKDFIISSSPIDTTGKKFAFTVNGEPTNLTVIKTAGGLKAVRPGMKIIFR